MQTLVELAEQIARKAHAGQTRRDGITPYLFHVEGVVHRVRNAGEKTIAAAWLHDVLEDTSETWKSLQDQGVPIDVVRSVLRLTKDDCVPHRVYMDGIKRDLVARTVKLADMLTNLADEPTVGQIRRYATDLLFLTEGV
ncbi:guanosine-3,5-bis(Diphosphate) 3-diphosphatase [Opitutaceae bacterium TAV5]|nr:guanosine-3,5-bis(Diphosphate) 3-diphosphatase [Opitutaceae bacterium TAV5]